MDVLLVTDENKSYYLYIKDFNRFMLHKIKNTFAKNTFAKAVYSVSVVKMFS